MPNIEQIEQLKNLIEGSGIHEIEIKEGDLSIRISQFAQTSKPAVVQTQTIKTPTQPVTAVQEPADPDIIKESANRKLIKCPMVGTFYPQPSPEAPPFVEIGQHVKRGQLLCIVEAMKMFNQIESNYAGKILECLVEPGNPVEFDQPLFVIETA
jgi:acetyl-CoA carboxylase biotin carboxyl carrier protein